MNTITLKARATRLAMLIVVVSGLFLSACDPSKIITTNTNAERDAHSWVQENCRKVPDGMGGERCALMGE